ncbi:hypothetical protein NMU00_02770 [Enterococcus faecalis]|uniref:hypothetical protein n=1 Tax=Enterococcus faecalis TaxID=1351 RepID=UPI00046C6FCB|nr:hypothetical protein [Enterococcus faecalis]RBS03478.1 hypothetical protein EA81_00713 [Enterococcus faecalis]HDV0856419.1 hypothetical protein [Enterococcus faecalis]HDV0888204.1 hypothetical protein [Enterococcus faecalis]
MNLITKDQIDSLYRKVNVDPNKNHSVSSFLNTGTMENKLNSSSLNSNLKIGNLNKLAISNY